MLKHEFGHIETYNTSDWKSRKPIIKDSEIKDYPNIMDEYRPFFNQFKCLIKKYGKDKDIISEKYLYDYRRGKKPEDVLKKYKIFFKELYEHFTKKI